ncbi:D-alanyl-D-alanine carboxypeptidase family protein [Candidatus Kaiserbacteria bacterium]|nr:MAG: D-alanyl-D-alanine carboxypeptidase family protein [Candidatus Kaiserbacteria bacterium]
MRTFFARFGLAITILLITVIGVLSYTLYRQDVAINILSETYMRTTNELSATQGTLSEKEAGLTAKEMTLEETKGALALAEENAIELSRLLKEETERNDAFEGQIKKVSGTVVKLDKLSKMDSELLMKYSKIYFLNEHYVPPKVVPIASTSLLRTDTPEYIDTRVAPFLTDMFEDALEDGIELKVVSGYRSFDEQKSLKNAYTVTYGSGANTFSADQGYSEHQLGTTIDLTTPAIGGTYTSFADTEAYAWLLEHAHRYGFVLSYPKDNAYYVFEPWHWRFVGEDLADDLHDDGKSFYDTDQRKIDTYLISIFD